jgi:tRNA threonylcarbamoyladenosine biosynthesis protein TsaE
MATDLASIELISASAEETQRIGEAIGDWAPNGTVLLLHGDLGAGKTTLTQGLARGLGIAEPIQSPTFTLVAEHQGAALRLLHLDLYRLSGPDELESLGFDQFLEPVNSVTVIEWPERAGHWLPDAYLLIELTSAGPDRRRIRLQPFGAIDRWRELERGLSFDASVGSRAIDDAGAG